MNNKAIPEYNETTVCFFLTDDEQVAFEQYCQDRLVYPYVSGQTLVREFLMKDTKSLNNEADVTESNEASVTERNTLDDAWDVIKCLVEKNEKQEELLAVLDDKLYSLCAVVGDTLQIARETNKRINHIESEVNAATITEADFKRSSFYYENIAGRLKRNCFD